MRMAHPLAFASSLKAIGAPAERYFRNCGLPAYAENPNVYVKVCSAWAVFDNAAKAEGEDFGWFVGGRVGESGISQELLACAKHSPTLYRGLHDLVRLISSEASDLGLGVEEREADVLLYTYYPTMRGESGYLSSQAYQLPAYLAFIRHYLGAHWYPDEIGIEAKRVPMGAELCFPDTRIRSGQERGYIAVPRDVLTTSPPAAIDWTRAPELLLTADLLFAERLRILLRPYMSERIPTKQFSARLMETSERTLSRRLSASGLTYRALIDELIFEEAKDLLRGSQLSIREIAARVGYSDPAHFTRTFYRISGLTPSEFRNIEAGCTTRCS
jgi:AraC-like DNA-binding protein